MNLFIKSYIEIIEYILYDYIQLGHGVINRIHENLNIERLVSIIYEYIIMKRRVISSIHLSTEISVVTSILNHYQKSGYTEEIYIISL